jgi:hypothetical protein
VTLLKEDGRGAAMFVANESKFRGTFTDTYEDAGHAVRLA